MYSYARYTHTHLHCIYIKELFSCTQPLLAARHPRSASSLAWRRRICWQLHRHFGQGGLQEEHSRRKSVAWSRRTLCSIWASLIKMRKPKIRSQRWKGYGLYGLTSLHPYGWKGLKISCATPSGQDDVRQFVVRREVKEGKKSKASAELQRVQWKHPKENNHLPFV